MVEQNRIIVFSVPRTGTNHLFFTMANIKRLDVRFEVFNKMEAYTISAGEVRALAEKTGYSFETNKDPAFIKWVKENPLDLVNFIQKKTSKNHDGLMFKVFPNHLDFSKIEQLITDFKTTKIVIIKRKPIDVFISMMKSAETGKYLNHDTSNLQIEANFPYFKMWWNETYNWYKTIENLIDHHALPNITLSYEQDIDLAASLMQANILAKFNALGVNFEFDSPHEATGLVKQDSEQDYNKKVKNWNLFKQQLIDSGYYSRAFGSF